MNPSALEICGIGCSGAHDFSALGNTIRERGEGMERFSCETSVVCGVNALDILGQQPCRKLLVVSAPGVSQQERNRKVVEAAGNPETQYLDIISAEATMKQSVDGSRKIRSFRPDLVTVVGDGTVMDCGKAMVGFSRHSCRLAVIPTAFDAGTEVTDRVTLDYNGRKHLLQDEAMRPDLAVLDNSMIVRTTKTEIMTSGFELLAAAMEAYVSESRGLLSDIHAREAFALVWAALPAACAGNERARAKLQAASVMTGLAVERTGLGLCRAMENSLGMVFGLSRGKVSGILLPAIVGCNAHAAGGRYAELSRAAGMGGSNEGMGVRNLRSGLLRLRRELGMPGTLLQAGIDIRTIWNSGKRIVELTLEDPECRNNPVTVDDYLVRRILEEITGRF